MDYKYTRLLTASVVLIVLTVIVFFSLDACTGTTYPDIATITEREQIRNVDEDGHTTISYYFHIKTREFGEGRASVSRSIYGRYKAGDTVNVLVTEGSFSKMYYYRIRN